MVVRTESVASRVPSSPTRAALVNVDPKSTQSSRVTRSSAQTVERLLQVGDEVVDVLDAHREADQVGRHLELGAGHRGVRHARRVLDEGLDAPEGLAEGEQLGLAADLDRDVLA